MKKALVIGIDDYPGHPLRSCVHDAGKVAELLWANGDGSPNFDVDLITSERGDVTNLGLEEAISRFFRSETPVETAVVYFAGHGIINPLTDEGYILGIDSRKGALGFPLTVLLSLANAAYPTIASSLIILDCCHAGFAGEITGAATAHASVIGKGVTILTACNTDQKAIEAGEQGVFTKLLLDALQGGCADVRGNITPAAVYTHIDQALGAKDQRPLYKANVHRFVTLRQVVPRIPHEVLRRLPLYFPQAEYIFALDPSYEPDRQSIADPGNYPPADAAHVRIFKHLQMYARQGLVEPVDAEAMFWAAMNSTGCTLTAMGRHYHRLALKKKL
ncbi:caspase family protein [Variovorax rhizosphaerae]|uniref:Caspase family protein n=1 Tax=Variovorax rhizosphaerae TaxID=1836200 RepID=A0ABU8WRN1_9BURK